MLIEVIAFEKSTRRVELELAGSHFVGQWCGSGFPLPGPCHVELELPILSWGENIVVDTRSRRESKNVVQELMIASISYLGDDLTCQVHIPHYGFIFLETKNSAPSEASLGVRVLINMCDLEVHPSNF
jgi:hypothetical protein